MTTNLKQNIQDFSQFQADVNHDTLPAVSFIKPQVSNDGHPGYSSLSKFESFATSITNSPAIGDLMQFFDFSHLRTTTPLLPNAAP